MARKPKMIEPNDVGETLISTCADLTSALGKLMPIVSGRADLKTISDQLEQSVAHSAWSLILLATLEADVDARPGKLERARKLTEAIDAFLSDPVV